MASTIPPSKMQWKPGEKVRFSSDGPEMKVRKQGFINSGTAQVEEVTTCQWFDKEGVLKEGTFAPDSLEAIK